LALFGSGAALANLKRAPEAVACFESCMALRTDAGPVHWAFAELVRIHLEGARAADAAACMSRLHEFEPENTPVDLRLETRIRVITSAARSHGLDVAAMLLEAALENDPAEIRERMAFLAPAIQYAKTGGEQALARLPDRERDAAESIAAALLGTPDTPSS
jgi:hypothetical protein